MNDMTTTVTPEERAQFQLDDSQIHNARGAASVYSKRYGDAFFCSAEFIVKLCDDALIARKRLEAIEAESAKQREQVSALLVQNETGMDLMDACMAEAEAISAHDDDKTGRTLETKTRLENVQACIMAAYGKARKAQEKCEVLGLKVTP